MIFKYFGNLEIGDIFYTSRYSNQFVKISKNKAKELFGSTTKTFKKDKIVFIKI